jgi:hypothetical protein
LLFLGELVFLARQEDSKYIIDALIRLNFVDLVVDSIQRLLAELRESKPEGVYGIPSLNYPTYTLQILNCRSPTTKPSLPSCFKFHKLVSVPQLL